MPRITKWGPTTRDKKKRQATFDWNPPSEYVDYESGYAEYVDFSYSKLIDAVAVDFSKAMSTAAAKMVDDVIADDLKEGNVEFKPQWWD